MNVNLMRYIDLYAGVPITLILTGVMRLANLFAPKRKVKPKKILFLELSEMGSTILADPAMRKARDTFGAELFFCIFAKNKESLFLLNTVDEKNIFTIRSDSFGNLAVDLMKFLFWTREKKIDTVVDLELFARVTAGLTGLSGATNRAGFFSYYNEGLYRGNMMTHKVAYNPHIHIAKNFIALVDALISDNGEIPYSKTKIEDEEIAVEKVHPSKEARENMREKVGEAYPSFNEDTNHIVLVNANASDLLPQRRWPLERFCGLVKKVLDYDENAVVLLTGSPSEREGLQQGLADVVASERCVNFAGNIELTEIPILYSIATLMVTNDSGPAHFSSVTEMPTFILFGPETPLLYGPLGNGTAIYSALACSPCVSAANHRRTACKDNVCLKVISEDTVFDMIKPHLKQKAKS